MPTSRLDSTWVLLARVVRPQGRRGEVLAEIFTDFPQAFTDRPGMFLRSPVDMRAPSGAPSAAPVMSEIRVQSQWLHKGRVVLKFVDVDSIEDAEKLRGCEVVIPREERMPLTGGAVYVSDLIGMMVVDLNAGSEADGNAGEIIDVEPEAAGPAMLVIRTAAGEERLIPFVRAYLRRMDIAARRLEMELPPGLLAMQAPASEQEKQAGLAQADDASDGD